MENQIEFFAEACTISTLEIKQQTCVCSWLCSNNLRFDLVDKSSIHINTISLMPNYKMKAMIKNK